jgi:hypothetical protein
VGFRSESQQNGEHCRSTQRHCLPTSLHPRRVRTTDPANIPGRTWTDEPRDRGHRRHGTQHHRVSLTGLQARTHRGVHKHGVSCVQSGVHLERSQCSRPLSVLETVSSGPKTKTKNRRFSVSDFSNVELGWDRTGWVSNSKNVPQCNRYLSNSFKLSSPLLSYPTSCWATNNRLN